MSLVKCAVCFSKLDHARYRLYSNTREQLTNAGQWFYIEFGRSPLANGDGNPMICRTCYKRLQKHDGKKLQVLLESAQKRFRSPSTICSPTSSEPSSKRIRPKLSASREL